MLSIDFSFIFKVMTTFIRVFRLGLEGRLIPDSLSLLKYVSREDYGW